MKRAVLTACLCLAALPGCKGEDLKKQLAEKSQIVTAQEAEIKRLKDDMAARETELKNQMEQRIQKITAQSKQQVDALSAKVAELTKKKDKEADKHAKTAPAKTTHTKKSRP